MFKAATQQRISIGPGEGWRYSNVGYFLLGMIIEKASGQNYGDFLRERFFKPLGMTATSVPDRWAIIKNRTDGYTLRNGQPIHFRYVGAVELSSYVGIHSTVKDLIKWDTALGAGKLVKKSSLDLMWTPVKLNGGTSHPYGFGWRMDERHGHRLIYHRGASGAEYSRYPDDGLTVIVLTNLGLWDRTPGPEVQAFGLTEGVAAYYVPKLGLNSLKEQPDPSPQTTQQVRDLLSDIANEKDSPVVTKALRRAGGQNMKNITASRLKQLQSFSFITCDDGAGRIPHRYGEIISRACHYKMKTRAETYYYTFWMTPDGAVADFRSSAE
jgi:CubicO group peptidase (beta-lactamase class C family)